MANEKNLVPQNKRTKSEQRKIAIKGGKASGEARREKKTMREYADFLLSLPVTSTRDFNKLSKMGVPVEGIDNKMLVVAALMLEAQSGDVTATKELRNLIAEDRPDGADSDAVKALDTVLLQLNEVMKRDAGTS